ncbi:nucleoside triphosphate hydrolase [Nocardia sp. NPDC048505]|uniref:nucleoside triphosphate hydrolase n=1 Tax=Nocardia sp. NPDC048505 TaxID=3155756 RepID=UPI00340FCEEA
MADVVVSLDELALRVLDTSANAQSRYVVGIAGPPAAGKSTLSVHLRDAINARKPNSAQIAPMDGFHHANETLRVRGSIDRKGQPDTFDVAAFLSALERLHTTPVGQALSWPAYDRALHDPVDNAIDITDCSVAVVEGNYLLLNEPGWAKVRSNLEEAWFLDEDTDVIEPRLLQRQLDKGNSLDQAKRHVTDSDLANARLIADGVHRADLILRVHGDGYLMTTR